MSTIDLNGLGVALVTPFKKNGEIDFAALDHLVNHIIDGGADYLVVLGTTGESVTLTADERKAVSGFVSECVMGRIPLVLGIGSNCTASLLSEISETDFSGYSAILSVAPFYNKPTQEGIYRHFSALAEESPLPIILYNIPGRTGVNITAETTLRLSNERKNIIAIKEASGNLEQARAIIEQCKDNFKVISGDDALTTQLMSIGASGVISVLGNAIPGRFSKMVHDCMSGNYDQAELSNQAFQVLYKLLFIDGNPAGIKGMLSEMGIIENVLRLPLVEISSETQNKLREQLNLLEIK